MALCFLVLFRLHNDNWDFFKQDNYPNQRQKFTVSSQIMFIVSSVPNTPYLVSERGNVLNNNLVDSFFFFKL